MTTITPNSNIKEKGILLNTMVQVVFLLTLNYQPKPIFMYLQLVAHYCFAYPFILNCTAKISKIFEICKSLRNYFINYFITLSLSVFTALSGRVVLRLIWGCYSSKQAINHYYPLTNAQYKICNNPN